MLNFQFPKIAAIFPALPSKTARLVFAAGGRPPQPGWLKAAATALNAPVWAIDRGIGICRRDEVRPIRLTGDADSAAKDDWSWAEKMNVPIDKFASTKDLTDFQLALELSRQDYPSAFLIVTGAFGGRLDHAFSLLCSLAHDGRPACLIDEREAVFILRGTATPPSEYDKEKIFSPVASLRLDFTQSDIPAVLSLLPLSAECRGVNISGVRWPLANARLTQSLPYAISNEPVAAENMQIEITSGLLGVYLAWGEMPA